MGDDIKILVKFRGGIRAAITKKVKEIENISNTTENVPGKEAILQGGAVFLTEKKLELGNYNKLILNKLAEADKGEGDDGIDKELEVISEYDDQICIALARVSLIEKNQQASSRVTHSRVDHAKLPKLTMQRFGGDIKEWASFWEGFESAVDKNSSLSDIDKLNYLRSLLEGQAALCISGLSLSGRNYVEAIDILKNRFGDEQLLVNNCIQTLMNMQPIKSDHELFKIRHFYDNIESNIRSLRALNIDVKSYGPILLPMIMPKLPPDIRLNLTRKNLGWDLMGILKHLLDEISAREKCGFATGDEKDDFTTSSFSTVGGRKLGVVGDAKCIYCKKQHKPSECQTISIVDERKAILRKERRCFNCTSQGHIVLECSSKFKCAKCGKKGHHHTSICYAGEKGVVGKEGGRNTEESGEGATDADSSTTVGVTTIKKLLFYYRRQKP